MSSRRSLVLALLLVAGLVAFFLSTPFASAGLTDGVCTTRLPIACYTAASHGTTAFDGTAASCTSAFSAATQPTYYPDRAGSLSGSPEIKECQVMCCCEDAQKEKSKYSFVNGNPVANTCQVSAQTEPKGFVTVGQNCDAICGMPTCTAKTTITSNCICGSATLHQTDGKVCCDASGATAATAAQCPSTPTGSNLCPTGVTITAATACTCGSAQITSGVCCSNYQNKPDVASCPAIAEQTSCGNNKKEGIEQCDAPAQALGANAIVGVPCPKDTNNKDQLCTAQCTCVPQTTISCGNKICESGETAITCPGDCPVVPQACDASNADLLKPRTVTATYNAAQKAVVLTWLAPTQCADTIEGYRIGRGNKTITDVVDHPSVLMPASSLLPATTFTYTDTTIPRTATVPTLYYVVYIAFKNGGRSNATTQLLIPTASCPSEQASYCGTVTSGSTTQSAAINCDAYGVSSVICKTNMNPPEVCIVPQGGQAQCIAKAADCSACNGLFGMYPDDSLTVSEGAASDVHCSEAYTCYRDLASTAVELYQSCSKVRSCASYQTKTACEKNQCGVSGATAGSCKWNIYDPGTGKGVCGATSEAFAAQSCSDCNAGDGSCNPQLCRAIGLAAGSTPLCTFAQKPDSSLPSSDTAVRLDPCIYMSCQGSGTCAPSANVPCEIFTTKDDCIGGPSDGTTASTYAINAQYDASNVRTGGTNAITSRSNDLAAHGKCQWNGGSATSGYYCRKNADGDNRPDILQYPNVLNAPWIYSLDFTAPQTSILATPNTVYPMAFSVTLLNESKVYACLSKEGAQGDPCSPKDQALIASGKVTNYFTAADSGTWHLRYYGEKTSRNIEEVKSFNFSIDAQAPIINITNVSFTPYRLSLPSASGAIRTRVRIEFNSSEMAKCNTTLKDGGGNSVTSVASAQLTNAYGKSFAVVYDPLVDLQYEFAVSCIDDTGNINATKKAIIVDNDRQITAPTPMQFSPLTNATITMGVSTNNVSNCRYGTEGQLFSQMKDYTTTGGMTHRVTIPVTSGAYRFVSICNFTTANGWTLISGDPSDDVVFWVDQDAPTGQLCNADNNNPDIPCALVQNNAQGYRITIQCTDQPGGTDGRERFGCDAALTRTCTYNPASAGGCTPTTGSTMSSNTQNPFTIIYRLYDKGGNNQQYSATFTPKDTTPPADPAFSLYQ